MTEEISTTESVTIEVQDLVKTFGQTMAVDSVEFTIEPGEFFSLLGSSGCGKTTTLRCIAGLELPTSGSIRFSGKDVAQVPPHLRDCGMVFQNYALFPHMTVAENVAYGLMARRYREAGGLQKLRFLYQAIFSLLRDSDAQLVDEALALVELEGLNDRKPQQLSGGQQQRVALARALVTKPKVLLFDEPLGALDARLRVKMREEIRRIQKRSGITTVYVTHDQEEALAVSDRIAVMNKGKIVSIGTPTELYRQPKSRFLADFLGMKNVFPVVSHSPQQPYVLEGGVALTAEFENLPESEQTWLVLRPDSLRFSASGEASENVFSAQVLSHHFMGTTVDYVLQAPFGKIRVVRPRLEPVPLFSEGDRIELQIEPREVLVVGE